MIEELKNYTYEEAGKLLGGISASTIRRMVKSNLLKKIAVGRNYKKDGTLSRGRPRIPGWAIIEYNLAEAESASVIDRRPRWQPSIVEKNQGTFGAASKTQTALSLEKALESLQKKHSKKKPN